MRQGVRLGRETVYVQERRKTLKPRGRPGEPSYYSGLVRCVHKGGLPRLSREQHGPEDLRKCTQLDPRQPPRFLIQPSIESRGC